MKYLKLFKIFESSSDDLLETINDIFISLDDLGVEYEIDDLDIGLICITIYSQNEEINDCVGHLENYLKDLGYLYFIGKSGENQPLSKIHISIENNFNKEIEKDFLKIIYGIREVKHKNYPKSRIFVNPDNYCLFNLIEEFGERYLSYDFNKIHIFFKEKYSLDTSVTKKIIRYMVGKHLKLDVVMPSVLTYKLSCGLNLK